MKYKLTEQDLLDIQYFWQYKGDLERLSTFESLKPLLEKEKPELLKALNDYETSLSILNSVVENLI